jgi:hypothetical protein
MTMAPQTRRIRYAFGGLALMLALRAGAPAQGQGVGPPAFHNHEGAPASRSGKPELIRIGPQALVLKYPDGRVTMADEPSARPSTGKNLGAMGGVFGVLGAGVFLLLEDQGAEWTFSRAGAAGVR